MRKKQQQNDTIIIKSIKKHAQTETLERIDADTTAERVLGIRLPLSSSMTIEKKFRKKQLKEFCTSLYKSPLTHYEAHSAYQSRYKSIATLSYTVTMFTSSELMDIQKGVYIYYYPN